MTTDGAYLLPGKVRIIQGRAFAIMQANMKTPWVWRYSPSIKQWVSSRPYEGEHDQINFVGQLCTPADALAYGIEQTS